MQNCGLQNRKMRGQDLPPVPDDWVAPSLCERARHTSQMMTMVVQTASRTCPCSSMARALECRFKSGQWQAHLVEMLGHSHRCKPCAGNAIDNLNAVSKAASRSGARRDGRSQRDFESLKKSARHLLVRTTLLTQLRIAENHLSKQKP